jgi:hypothetical protein
VSARRTGVGFAIAAVAALCLPSQSRAFSDPSTFDQSAVAAGGGERHFTGSPADGYSCQVCHDGGREPSLRVTGLPLSGYEPGASYEIVVAFGAADKIATALEFTDERGRVAGSLRLPEEPEIQPKEYCEPATDKILAASLTELASGRQIIHVPDCGARQVRFLWTAPRAAQHTIWFSGAAVQSDGEADAYHDGVTEYGRVLSASGTASNWTAAACSAAPGGASGALTLTTWSVALLAFGRRRRRR